MGSVNPRVHAASGTHPTRGDFLFGTRPINIKTSGSSFSRYEDDKWDLSPLVAQIHVRRVSLNFVPIPQAFRAAAKEFAFALLAKDQPGGEPLLRASSIYTMVQSVGEFFRWLDSKSITRLGDVSRSELQLYFQSLIVRGKPPGPKKLRAVKLLFVYGPLMESDRLTVDPAILRDWKPRKQDRSEVKTPRIPEPVLLPLIIWAERWVNDFADDVARAQDEYVYTRSRSARLHTSLDAAEGYASLLAVLEEYAASNRSLPSHLPQDGSPRAVNLSHLARQANCTMDVVQRVASDEVRAAVARLGLDDGVYLLFQPEALIDGERWLRRIPFWSVKALVELLQTACYVVVAFYSGMRDSEIKHLRRNCVTVERDSSGTISRVRIDSLAFKGEDTVEGVPATWVIGSSVVAAIEVLERIMPSEDDYLFSKLRLQRNFRSPGHEREGTNMAPTASQTSRRINDLSRWIVDYCLASDRGDGVPLVDGASWNFTTKQFRRTLAWFIARRPGGSIAGAMQFRHRSVQMFEGYAGTSDSGFRAEVEAEEALVRGEYLLAAVDNHLHDQLVGPGAEEGRRRLKAFSGLARFVGVVAESPQQLRRLISNNDPHVYMGDLVTCIFDPSKALCLRGLLRGTPELSACDPLKCSNAALTPANVTAWEGNLAEIDDALSRRRLIAPYVVAKLEDLRVGIVSLLQRRPADFRGES